MVEQIEGETVEQKMIKAVKNTGLAALLEDEVAIKTLSERALQEALYQPVRIPKSYGGFEYKDSIVVEAARDIARTAVNTAATQMVQELIANPEVRTAIMDAIIKSLPAAIASMANMVVSHVVTEASNDAVSKVVNIASMVGGITPANAMSKGVIVRG